MTFEFTPATRQNVSLLIGMCGSSGSGKTYSALALATGLAGPDGRIAAIDTEAGRMLHYADQFKFDHGDLRPPFSPERYIEAITAADQAGYDVIVIDSLSHEWESEGGLQDMHSALLDVQVERARKNHSGSWAFDEDKTRERLSVGAWKEPKSKHKKFVSKLLQCRAHLIMCMRADEKMRIEKVKDERGREKTVIIQAKDMPPAERWSPICERRFPYELTLSIVLTPQNPGYPVPIKLQRQHHAMFPEGTQIGEQAGKMLRDWALGGVLPSTKPPMDGPVTASGGPTGPSNTLDELIEEGQARADAGIEAYRDWWSQRTDDDKRNIGPAMHDLWIKRAKAAKAGAET